jgi:tetratricopeptide (TPR) repeat protein
VGGEVTRYISTSGNEYVDWLQARTPTELLTLTVDRKSREIIGTIDEFRQRGLAATGEVAARADKFLIQVERFSNDLGGVSNQLDGISSDLGAITSLLDWGFTEIKTSLDKIGQSLERLLHVTEFRSGSWALEQYRRAQDRFRRQLYPAALEAVNWAINGYGGEPGERADHRFHYLLGVIRLGSLHNRAPAVVDPAAAEQAFLEAAKCARSDHPNDAASAMLSAGWAAYVVGALERADAHTRDALRLLPTLSEAHFQLALLEVEAGKVASGLQELEVAVDGDPLYLVRADADEVFKRHQAEYDAFLRKLRSKYREQVEHFIRNLRVSLAALEAAFTRAGSPPAALAVIHDGQHYVAEVSRKAQEGTILGLLQLRQILSSSNIIDTELGGRLRILVEEEARRHKEHQESLRRLRDRNVSRVRMVLAAVLGAPCAILAIPMGISATSAFYTWGQAASGPREWPPFLLLAWLYGEPDPRSIGEALISMILGFISFPIAIVLVLTAWIVTFGGPVAAGGAIGAGIGWLLSEGYRALRRW